MNRKDWLLLSVVFAVSGILGFWALHMARQALGTLPAVGLGLVFAVSVSAICACFWRVELNWHAPRGVHMTAIGVVLVVAAVAFLLGAKFNGQGLLYVARHGMPDWSGFRLQGTWAWVFMPALGVAYIQIWTLIRGLFHTARQS